jgi:hypothetical protein
MKSSAWYHKLWRKKLGELPYEGDTDKAWSAMNKLLDEQLPASHPASEAGRTLKPFAAKVVSVLGFVLPVAAMVCAVSYFLVNKPHIKTITQKHDTAFTEKLTGEKNNKPTLVDSNLVSIPGMGPDSFNRITQGRYNAGIGSLNNIIKNNNQKNIQQQFLIMRPLATKKSNDSNLTIVTEENRSKTNIQSLITPLPLKGTKQTEVFNHIPVRPAPINGLPVAGHHESQTADLGLSFNQKQHIKGAAKLNPKRKTINSLNRNPALNNRIISNDHKGDLQIDGLMSSLSKASAQGNLNNKSQELPLMTQSEGITSISSDPQFTDLESSKKLIAGSDNGLSEEKTAKHKKDKTSDLKGIGQNKVVKTRHNSIFNSLFNNLSNSAKNTYGSGFNYGIKAGYSASNKIGNIYLGTYMSFEINQHLFFMPELLLSMAKTVSGSYTHASYFRPDSIAPFTITDSRKVYMLDVPLNIGYKLTPKISLKAGPTFSIPIKQTGVVSKLGNVPDLKDTLMHTQSINTALNRTVLTPKFNMGISAGIGVQAGRFNIDARYQQSFRPYKVSSDLGAYQFTSHSLMFGIGFQLNKRH